MGSGIAQIAAVAGHPVKLLDAREGAAASAIESVRTQLNKLADKGRLTPQAAQAAGERLSVATLVSELADAALIIEAIVEDLAAKQSLFVSLESIVSDDAILSTNTSSISITAIGAALKRPERLAGLHFFNPAPLMPLVEIISGIGTDASVPMPLTISTKGIKGAGLKKCSPAKRSGRFSAAPMAVMDIDEVFVDRIASSETMLSSDTNSDCFAARSSTIASTMSAASASSDTCVATLNRSPATCAASGVRRPLSASLVS